MDKSALTIRVESAVLSVAAVACIVLMSVHSMNAARIRQFGVPETGMSLTPVSGMAKNGEWIGAAANSRCHVVRFGSRTCPFSRSDDYLFRRLETKLIGEGCDSTVLAPSSDVQPDGYSQTRSRHILNEVSLEFLRHAKLTRTPTTMILAQRWRLIWLKVGVMTEQDLAEISRLSVVR